LQPTENSKETYLYYQSSTIHLDPPCALTCRGPRSQLQTLQASMHTAAEPLPSTLLPRLGLTDAFKLFPLRTHYIPSFKTTTFSHRALAYLYFHLARDPSASRLYYYFFTLFLGGIPFDSTYYSSRSMLSVKCFTLILPTILAFTPHTHSVGIALPNSPPTQSS